jgi:hypothetical protein
VDVFEKPVDAQYRPEDMAHWLKANVLGRALVQSIDKNNFEMKVLNSLDPWLVVFCNEDRYQICSLTRKAFNRMAYVLAPLGVKVGRAYCPEEQKGEGADFGWWLDEWCEVDIGVQSLGEGMSWNYPFVKIYKRGPNKGGGDSINLNVRPPKFEGEKMVPDQILQIIEKVVIIMAFIHSFIHSCIHSLLIR